MPGITVAHAQSFELYVEWNPFLPRIEYQNLQIENFKGIKRRIFVKQSSSQIFVWMQESTVDYGMCTDSRQREQYGQFFLRSYGTWRDVITKI